MGIEEKKGYAIIEMSDCLFLDNIEYIVQCLIVGISHPKEIVLDMTKVNNLHSSGLRLITLLLSKVMQKGSKLFIVGASDRIRSALFSVNLDSAITLFDSVLDFEMEREWLQEAGKAA